MNYYNEFDPKAAAWIRELMKAGLIPNGEVDERSITDVRPSDLTGYAQCHFFAGIGGWPYTLRLAGWPDDMPVWTGSCPCQPFSVAGKGKGLEDERHLWPAWFELIKKCKPSAIMGEQVEAALGMGWLDIVFNDLESLEYSTCGVVLPASAVGAPHIRSRIFWAATAEIKNERMHKVRRDIFGNEILQRQDQGRWAQRILQGLRQRITPGIYREEQGTPERIPAGLVQKTTCIKNEKAKSEIKGVKHRIGANKRSEVKGEEKGRPLRLGQPQRANNKTGQCGEMRADRDAPKPCREEVVQQCFIGQNKAGIRLHLQQCASCGLLCELCFGNLGGGEIDGNCEAIIEGEKLNGSARIYAQMDNESNTREKNNPNPAGVGAPHIRQRLWWVGYAKDGNWKISERKKWENSQFGRPSGFGGLVNILKPGLEGHAGDGYDRDEPGRIDSEPAGSVAATSWNGPSVWWPCRDGKFRRVPVEPVFQPIFDGLPGVLGCVWNPITKNIKEWVIDYAKKTERSPDQILREVWETTLSQTLREEFGRHDCVYEKEILLLAMCKLAWGSKYEFYFSTSDFAAICERTLRALWGRKKSSCPPQKWGLDRPPEGEPGNTLYPLPLRGGTQETSQNVQVLSIDSAKERNVSEAFSAFQEIWRSIFDQNSAAGVSKQLHADKNTIIAMGGFPLAPGLPGRVGLLRGAGNAIVPQVAAEFIGAAMETIDDLK